MKDDEKYISILNPWKEWVSFVKKDFDGVLPKIRQELQRMQTKSLMVKQRLLYVMMNTSQRDFLEEKALSEEIIKENPSVDNIKNFAKILAEIDLNKALYVAESYAQFNYKFFADILACLYAKQKNLDKLLLTVKKTSNYSCNDIYNTLEAAFQNSNNDGHFIESIALALLLPEEEYKEIHEDKRQEYRKEISLLSVKWLNMTNMYSTADAIADLLLQRATRAPMPEFRPDRTFYFSPYLGYEQHHPLMITFNAIENDALVSHYKEYGLDKLEQLYGSKKFPCMNFFKGINKFNLLHVLDEFQIWGQMNFSQIFLYMKNFIAQLEPSHLIFFGTSAGGFCSLLYGILFNADLIIAPYPQTTAFHLQMRDVRRDLNRKYLFSLSPYCYINRIMKMTSNKTPKTICYSSGNIQDKEQINLIKNIDSSIKITTYNAGSEHNLFQTYGSQWLRDSVLTDIKTYCNL